MENKVETVEQLTSLPVNAEPAISPSIKMENQLLTRSSYSTLFPAM